MTTDTSKSKSRGRGKFERQFIAPFSLQECKSRLESYRESINFWRWTRPITVNTWSDLNGLLNFQIYRGGHEAIPNQPYQPLTRAHGTLYAQADGTTLVYVMAGTLPSGYILYAFFILWHWMLCAVLSFVFMLSTYQQLAIVVFIPLTGLVTLWHIHHHFNSEHTRFLAIVESTLQNDH